MKTKTKTLEKFEAPDTAITNIKNRPILARLTENCLIKAYIPQFLLPDTSYPAFCKNTIKLLIMLKDSKKHRLKIESKYQSQIQSDDTDFEIIR